MEIRIYERDTDALFLRMLRRDSALADLFCKRCGLDSRRVTEARGQQRHAVDTGSIDIVVRLSGGVSLFVENKIDAAYSITRDGHDQPARYQRTVAAFRRAGAEAFSVLVAPATYLATSRLKEGFDAHLAYEDVRPLLAGPELEVLNRAISQAAAPYEPLPNEGAGEFFAAARQLIDSRYPDLAMKHEPNGAGVRPSDSRTIYFDVPRTLALHPGVPRPRMSLQCWDKLAPSASVKIMLGGCAGLADSLAAPDDLVDVGGYLRRAGRSLGIVIDTPRLDTQRPLIDQSERMEEALNAALRLQCWWRDNGPILARWAAQA